MLGSAEIVLLLRRKFGWVDGEREGGWTGRRVEYERLLEYGCRRRSLRIQKALDVDGETLLDDVQGPWGCRLDDDGAA